MTLSDQMRRLSQQVLEAYDARMAAVTGIRTEMAQELNDFRAAHQAITAEQRQRLSEHLDALRNDVTGLRRNAAAFLRQADTGHQSMAAEQRQRL
ncbi:MAG TPA: hypothetical protein DEP84_15170, partial [Chloroflexi bacterium]|nr:hypothetical protein [Chloroflexota bacterium]